MAMLNVSKISPRNWHQFKGAYIPMPLNPLLTYSANFSRLFFVLFYGMPLVSTEQNAFSLPATLHSRS
jgi:hypothetical protein